MGSVSEIPFSDLEAKFNVLGDVVGWGTRGIGSQDIPLDHITMSRVLQKMPIRITHEKACQHLYEHFKVDVKKQGCAYGLRDEATSRVGEFINLSFFRIFFKQNFIKPSHILYRETLAMLL